MQEIDGCEMLNQKLQEILKGFFNQIDRQEMELCICCQTKKSWMCLSGSTNSKNALEAILDSSEAWKQLEKRPLENVGKEVLYCARQNNINDSRLIRDTKKESRYTGDLLWVFLCRKRSVSLQHLSMVVYQELKNRFTDLYYFEVWKDAPWYFLGRIQNREELLHLYVNHILADLKLPPWNIFVQISAAYYEQRQVSTRMLFCEAPEKAPYPLILKNCPPEESKSYFQINASNLRTIRKLMEMSGSGHALLVCGDHYQIEGLMKTETNGTTEDKGICVDFLEHMVWNLIKDGEVLFKYRKGEYILQGLEDRDDKNEQLKKLIYLTSPEAGFVLTQEQVDHLKKIILMISEKACHGSSIVFYLDKNVREEEVKRLSEFNRAYCLSEIDQKTGNICSGFDLLEKEKELDGLLAIDGALLADGDGKCYAVGALLDGPIHKSGNPGRGARYNSLVNYVNIIQEDYKTKVSGSSGVLCFAAIFSEDKMLDIEISEC